MPETREYMMSTTASQQKDQAVHIANFRCQNKIICRIWERQISRLKWIKVSYTSDRKCIYSLVNYFKEISCPFSLSLR